MNKLIVVFIFIFIGTFKNVVAQKNEKLTIQILNIKNTTGKSLRVGIFKSDNDFPDGNRFKEIIVNPIKSSSEVTIELLSGEYAVAIYHDINENKILDKSFFGFPKEPFGFSNNYNPTVSGPDFSDCKFILTSKNNKISIKLLE